MTSSEELKFDAEFMAQAIKIAIEELGESAAADQMYLTLWCLRIIVGIERCVNDARRTAHQPPFPVNDPGILSLAKQYIQRGLECIDVPPPPEGYSKNYWRITNWSRRWGSVLMPRLSRARRVEIE
jgi:hypothetical protein